MTSATFSSAPSAIRDAMKAPKSSFLVLCICGVLISATKLEGNSTILRGYSRSIFERKDRGQNNYSSEENCSRIKRGVVHLYNMINCATGCDPLIYKGYGCFCGFLGSGYPVDGIDRCCKIHDWCYDATNCSKFFVYLIPYYWQCFDDKPLCAIEHGEFGGPNSCSYKLCQCDKMLSECLSRFPCPKKRAICKSSAFRFIQNVLMMYP